MSFITITHGLTLLISQTPHLSPRRRQRPPTMKTPSPISLPLNLTISCQQAETPTFYFHSLGISPEFTSRLLSRHPTLANHPNLRSLATPIITYLSSTLHLTPSQINRTLRYAPQILYAHPCADHPSRLHFLDHVARIPPEKLPQSISKCPHILWMDIKSASKVVHTVLEACPSITPAVLGSIFVKVPQALVTSPAKLQSNIENIRRAGVSDAAAMARVISKEPLVLVYDSKKTVEKRLEYFVKELGLSSSIVGKILVCTPEVLGWSIKKKLKPRVALLQGLVGMDAVSGTFDKVPSIFAINDILDRVLWLRDHIGLNETDIQTVIREAPAILTYSIVGNLAPKWTFIHNTMGGTKEDIVAAPKETLCANLQQRAMPRYAFLASSGRTDVQVLDVLKGSDHEFCHNVANCEADTFRAYVDNDTYLLFFSQLL